MKSSTARTLKLGLILSSAATSANALAFSVHTEATTTYVRFDEPGDLNFWSESTTTRFTNGPLPMRGDKFHLDASGDDQKLLIFSNPGVDLGGDANTEWEVFGSLDASATTTIRAPGGIKAGLIWKLPPPADQPQWGYGAIETRLDGQQGAKSRLSFGDQNSIHATIKGPLMGLYIQIGNSTLFYDQTSIDFNGVTLTILRTKN
jgi:hypothetical protein